MLDRNYVRNNLETIREMLRSRLIDYDLTEFEQITFRLRDLMKNEQEERNRLNVISKEIGVVFGKIKKGEASEADAE